MGIRQDVAAIAETQHGAVSSAQLAEVAAAMNGSTTRPELESAARLAAGLTADLGGVGNAASAPVRGARTGA